MDPMAIRLANRPGITLGLALVAAVFGFLAVNQFRSKVPGIPSVAASAPLESDPERTVRLEREQSNKDWVAAQKRADVRDAHLKAQRLAPNAPAVPR
jgi:hypothetical protein